MRANDVPREEFMLFVVRTVVSLCLVWAVAGSFGYWEVAKHFGWDKLSIEVNFSIFIALTVAGVALIAATGYGLYKIVRWVRNDTTSP